MTGGQDPAVVEVPLHEARAGDTVTFEVTATLRGHDGEMFAEYCGRTHYLNSVANPRITREDTRQQCQECGRRRDPVAHAMDAYEYSPLQAVTGRPLGWYSSERDGEFCGECIGKLMRPGGGM